MDHEEPSTIEGEYQVKGERQPIIKSWANLIAFLAIALALIGLNLSMHHH